MENRLSFVLRLPLKEMALRRLAVKLWNESDILLLIEKVSTASAEVRNNHSEEWRQTVHSNTSEQWREIVESRVRDKITELALPNSLMKQLLLIMTPIGLEIKRWKGFHEHHLSWRDNLNSYVEFNAPILAKLCWTPTGMIDYLKTAQELMLCEMLSNVNRYIIACLYCLEDFILHFWKKLPVKIKREFYDEKNIEPYRSFSLEFYWPYILKGKQSRLNHDLSWSQASILKPPCSFDLVLLDLSARQGNRVATDYFFRKLTDEEKDRALKVTPYVAQNAKILRGSFDNNCFPPGGITDVTCYLLSLMTQEQQMAFFKKANCLALCWFLEWPFQDIFLKMVDHIWDSFSERDCDLLMQAIYTHFWQTNYYSPELFQELFSRSPIKFKKVFVHRECGVGNCFPGYSKILLTDDEVLGKLLPLFFNIQDSDTIQVIFRNIDAEERYRLVSCKNMFEFFYNFILRDSWHMVEVCLRETILSEENRERVKIAFFRFLEESGRGEKEWRKRQWKRFFRLLDEIGSGSERKRSFEEDTLGEAQRLCTR